MGSKGPLVVLFIGIIGIAAFGMMANYVLRDPQTQRKFELKNALLAKYPISDASLRTKGRVFRLALTVEAERFAAASPAAAAGEAKALPADFAGIDDFFIERFQASPPYLPLEVSISVDGESAPRWRQTFQLEHSPRVQRQVLEGILGAGFRLEEDGERRVLVVHLDKDLSEQNYRRAAKQLARYRGLEWKRIELVRDGRVYPFDSKGKPLAP